MFPEATQPISDFRSSIPSIKGKSVSCNLIPVPSTTTNGNSTPTPQWQKEEVDQQGVERLRESIAEDVSYFAVVEFHYFNLGWGRSDGQVYPLPPLLFLSVVKN